jgi:hypothetical protein
MKETNDRTKLILWDSALLLGIILLCILRVDANHSYLITGILTGLIFSNCVRNHISVYKLNGKIY